MTDGRPELADVVREYGGDFLRRYGSSLSSEERRVLNAIARCRTAALGGHKWWCEDCGHEEFCYNSCRDRHCPKCQAAARAEWLEREASYLLPVEYFHVVFTLPNSLAPLALRNKRQIYDALFRAAAQTLSTLARDPKHLGGEIGFLMVLHTWGQNLQLHPHLHCVVAGGALSPDGIAWIECRKGFFLPVRVLSRLFRGKFLDLLQRLYRSGDLSFAGSTAELCDASAWRRFVDTLRESEWVVYSKPPFGGPAQVLKYLARYTHRVAISNQRLLSSADGKVRFRRKDYAHGSKWRVMTLDAEHFLRRFLLHVLPKGFVRIRHYGFLSNRCRDEKLQVIRALLPKSDAQSPSNQSAEDPALVEGHDYSTSATAARVCPRCKQRRLIAVQELAPQHFDATAMPTQAYDTS
jgi:hypothetical protein